MSRSGQPWSEQNDQPDLRDVVADAINQLTRNSSFRGDQPAEAVTPEQIHVYCQRTLRGVRTLNPKLNGGDLAACIAVVTQDADTFPWFFLNCRPVGEDSWRPVSSVGGVRKPIDEPFVGKLQDPRSFVAIGSLNAIPEGGGIRIELPDGTTDEALASEGTCIALMPIAAERDPDEPITIRYLNPDGSEQSSESV